MSAALDIRALQSPEVATRAHEDFDAMATRMQFVREVRADESGCASDEAIHAPP